jgi:excinuclease ABC subunit A
MDDKIVIKGARVHNLKNIDVEIPKNKLVVFTGISGSGKSSLAFDTIYAEGQRRYVESLAAYARQFLGVMDKPDVDYIEGLSPAISIDQKSASHNPRSTVGTITEIYDYLRLLFARIGHPHCPTCGREISYLSKEQITDEIQKLGEGRGKRGARVLILAPVVKDRKGEFKELFDDLRKKGYRAVRIDGKIKSLDEDFVLIKTNKHTIDVVCDRMVLPAQDRQRLSESVEAALRLGEGSLIIAEILDKTFQIPEVPKEMKDHLFSERFACPVDNISLPEIEPRSFSFNSPHGACPTCSGLGSMLEIDPDLVFNPNLSIVEGGILPWARISTHETWFSCLLEKVVEELSFSIYKPLGEMSGGVREILLYGADDRWFTVTGPNRYGRIISWDTTFEGIIPNLMRRYRETGSDYVRREIEKFMRVQICPQCLGARLKKESLSITIQNQSIWDVSKMSINKCFDWIGKLARENQLSQREEVISRPVLKELKTRLRFLVDVGLDYLTIDRQAQTLAGGEAQRIRLASQIGSGLSGVLYVLDEPSIGLHQKDNHRLLATLKKLRDLGNTVIVVEHDRSTMETADWILDFGPGAGEHGGEIVAIGTPNQITQNPKSLTGQYLSGKKRVEVRDWSLEIESQKSENFRSDVQPPTSNNQLTILGARQHNLKNINVNFPLGKFICITGVSGSGKSTLIHEILYKALAEKFYRSREKPGIHDGLLGIENVDKVILIDQSPIGRTPRSNSATYTGTFTFIRELFSKTKEARIRGYKPGRFSFNVRGGRCEACEGEGQVKIEMQFLPDVYVDCEVCHGKRYNQEALEIFYKEKNIAEVLDLTVEQALIFFQNIPPIKNKLQTLFDVGLGYIRLGQPAPTLSGGEAQRVKLATELSKRPTGHTLYILDEPTTGLHFADIERLLLILRRLVSCGNTVIIIEHQGDVIKNADWIIDLGPEGGDEGGEIVAEGTPQDLSKNGKSYTGQFLKRILCL